MKTIQKFVFLTIVLFAANTQAGRWLTRDPLEHMERDPQPTVDINLYQFVANNPISFVDPLGLEIQYANHYVDFGMNHSFIVIIPENQALYANNPDFNHVDSNGKRFATIGAGPSALFWGKLVGGVNREHDVNDFMKNRRTLELPCKYKNEDEAIQELFKRNAIYNKSYQHDYVLFPDNWLNKHFGEPGYNSNGFISGLGTAAGFNMNFNTGANTPGYGFPVPTEDFGPSF